MSTNDNERSRQPVEVTMTETIQKIHDTIMKDGRLKVREIA